MDNKILIEQSQHWEKSFSSKPEMFGSEPSYSAKKALENFKKKIKAKYEIISVFSSKDIQKTKKLLIKYAN